MSQWERIQRRERRDHADQMLVLGLLCNGARWHLYDLWSWCREHRARTPLWRITRALNALGIQGWVVDGWDDANGRRWYQDELHARAEEQR